MFEKYVLTFDRTHTMTAEALAAKFKYSPEIGDDVATEAEDHIEKCVYNPNLLILPHLNGEIDKADKRTLREIIEYTRFKYFTHYDVNYASYDFPVVADHCALPIFDIIHEAVVLKYITKSKGFKNIKKEPFIESEWEKKKIKHLPEVEKLYTALLK